MNRQEIEALKKLELTAKERRTFTKDELLSCLRNTELTYSMREGAFQYLLDLHIIFLVGNGRYEYIK